MQRLQVIDIGTNSIRSLVVEAIGDARHTVIDDAKETTRLGSGLAATGVLSDEAMSATIRALRAFLGIGRNLGVDRVRAVATAAVRTASNGPEFVDLMRGELGLEVEVVTGEEEGRLALLSATSHFPSEGRLGVVDIGGGSVEVVTAVGSLIEASVSLPLGARILAERFVDSDPIDPNSLTAMREHVTCALRASLPAGAHPLVLVGSGGTATSTASMVTAREGRQPKTLQGVAVTRDALEALIGRLAESTLAQRRKMRGLSPERAEVILPGAVVLAAVMDVFCVERFLVNQRGIREGIVIDTLYEVSATTGGERIDAVREFAARCGCDGLHAESVARLALDIHDQVAASLDVREDVRSLLHAAALLHDAGYRISAERHHHHSYHLIAHSALRGFTEREILQIAAIARYHTKSLPKPGHEAMAVLDAGERRTVEQAAALLRLGDGLDRGQAGHVERVVMTVGPDGATATISGCGSLEPELYGVSKKQDLFERVFGLALTVAVER